MHKFLCSARYTRVFLLLVLLLTAFSTQSVWQVMAATANPSPITLSAEWSVTNNADLEKLPGLWLAGIDNQGRRAIALAWVPVEGGWWPTWRLVLASDTGLLPIGNYKSVTVRDWDSTKGLNLGDSNPVMGHRYKALLSYNPQTGALSVSVTDLNNGQHVYTNGFTVAKTDVSLAVAAGQLGSPSPEAGVTNPLVTRQYVPMGTAWKLNFGDSDQNVSLSSADPTDKTYLHVAFPGPAPQGEYRMVFTRAGKLQELAVRPVVNQTVAFPLSGLPLGKAEFTLEYSENGQVTYTDTRSFTIGRVEAEVQKVQVDRNARTLNSALKVITVNPLNGLDVNVEATINEMVWDTTARNYRKQLYKKEIVTLAQNLTTPGGKKPVQLPIKLNLPNKAGLFEINIQPSVSPDINLTTMSTTTTFNTYAPAPAVAAGEPFTIAVFPDTQYMAANYPHILTRLTQWVLENADEKNISLMLQVGDLTDNNTPTQWTNVQNSLSQLNGLVPYAVSLGNHDMAPSGHVGSVAHRGESLFQDYFSPASFSGFQGNFPEGRLDNTYHTFNIGGADYLVVSLEFAPPDEALDWANKVVAAHPTHKTIVITHAYLGSNGVRVPQGRSTSYPMGQDKSTTMNDGEAIWYDFVRKHKNIFLVLSGHIYSSSIPWHIDKGINGNTVYEFLVDFQSDPNGGNGYLATFEFTPDNKMKINAYSPYLDTNKADANKYGYTSRFEFDLNTGRIKFN